MFHRDYDVWISDVDGRRIPEYNMQLEGADGLKTVTCYIPSESGKVSGMVLVDILFLYYLDAIIYGG